MMMKAPNIVVGRKWMHTIPETMRTWQIHKYGKNDVLRMSRESPVPEIRGAMEVLVRVHAASVNALDVRMRAGYGSRMMNILRRQQDQMPASSNSEFPLTLGRDCSGTVLCVGRGVSKFKPGDQVWGVISPFRQGSHADFVVAAQSELALKPRELSHVEAAAFPYVAVTAWSALCTIGGLNEERARGKRVLIHGAGGGIGTFVLQLLRAWDAEVTGVCGTESMSLVKELGANHVIDYQTGDVGDQLKGKRFDLALDAVGTDLTKTISLSSLKPWSDAKYINVVTPLMRNADDYGTTLGMAKSLFDLGVNLTEGASRGIGVRWAYFIPNGDVLTRIRHLILDGQIRPVIDEVRPFEQLPLAYDKMEKRQHRGKLVIRIAEDR